MSERPAKRRDNNWGKVFKLKSRVGKDQKQATGIDETTPKSIKWEEEGPTLVRAVSKKRVSNHYGSIL